MKHLTINEYGSFLGLESQRLVVKQESEKQFYPLNRLRTLSVAKRGVSLSSDLVQALSYRGIKLFFLDFKGTPYAQMIPANHHTVVGARVHQINFCSDEKKTLGLAIQIVKGKLLNQRATLLYYSKYKGRASQSDRLKEAAQKIEGLSQDIQSKDIGVLLGKEGMAASIYFQVLQETLLSETSFKNRYGRGSQEIINQMLNYGYGVLANQIMNCLFNAGLEPYLGFLHKSRPGKPSLVLDIMEEYRAWVVDRAVIKLRQHAKKDKNMSTDLRKKLVLQIMENLHTRHLYRSKRLELNFIIQRQVYRLSGHFARNNQYKTFLFKW